MGAADTTGRLDPVGYQELKPLVCWKSACVEGPMDVYSSKSQLQCYLDHYFIILRAIDPRLLPWKIGGNIFDTNPHLIHQRFDQGGE
jgi:hypothetical protein